jgi:hypothetical protein
VEPGPRRFIPLAGIDLGSSLAGPFSDINKFFPVVAGFLKFSGYTIVAGSGKWERKL